MGSFRVGLRFDQTLNDSEGFGGGCACCSAVQGSGLRLGLVMVRGGLGFYGFRMLYSFWFRDLGSSGFRV